MIRFFVLMLSVLFLYSCNSETPSVPISSETVPSVRPAVSMTETDAQTTAEKTDLIVYENRYTVTDLSDRISGLQSLYLTGDTLCRSQLTNRNGETVIELLMWNRDGIQEPSVFLPMPEGDVSAMDTNAGRMSTLPQHIIPISKGRYIMAYPYTRNGLSDGCMLMMSESGEVLLRTELRELMSGISAMRVYENDDGTMDIVYTSNNNLVVYDETFQKRGEIAVKSGTEFCRTENGCYLVGSTEQMLSHVNPEKGYTKPVALRLPESFRVNYIFYDANDRIYLSSANGLYRYNNNAQPKKILDWIDVGISYMDVGSDGALYILDDEHMYIREGMWNFYHTAIEKVPSSAKQIISLEAARLGGDSWLSDAIGRFNQSSSEYRVEMNVLGHTGGAETDEYLQRMLISDRKPDIFCGISAKSIQKYSDKNAFVDLIPYFGDSLLGSVKACYTVNGGLYQIPMMMQIRLFTSAVSVSDKPLTYPALMDISAQLAEGEYLASTSPDVAQTLENNVIMEFVDFENRVSDFNSDEFHRIIRYLNEMEQYLPQDYSQIGTLGKGFGTGGACAVTNGTMLPRVRDGGLKFVDTNLRSLEMYAALCLLYGDVPFVLCGYPSRYDHGSAQILDALPMSILSDTDNIDGCLAFLSFLLSDKRQTDASLTKSYLPVTRSGLAGAFEQCRYQYYDPTLTQTMEHPDTGLLPLNWVKDASPVLDEKDTARYYVTVFTEESERRLTDFLEHCSVRANADSTVAGIVLEELSYWKNNARTLEETTKIIDSRVWIYLNE